MSKHNMPFPRSGGAYQHDAASNSLQRVDEATGDGSGSAAAPLPASAYASDSTPMASEPAVHTPVKRAGKAVKTTKTRK
jgi:hypothetical protein